MGKRKIRKPKWDEFEKILRFIEVMCAFIGLLILVSLIYTAQQVNIAFKNLEQIKNLDSANMMLKYEDKLQTGKNYEIFNSIDQGEPLLIENGGKYSSQQINDYLGAFNSLDDIYESELITTTMLYDDFDDMIVKTSKNEEINKFLEDARKINPEYFGGFDNLVGALKPYQ